MITDDTIRTAKLAFLKTNGGVSISHSGMKAALEAVFAMQEKPDPKRLVNAIDVTGNKMKMPLDEVVGYPYVTGFEEIEPSLTEEDFERMVVEDRRKQAEYRPESGRVMTKLVQDLENYIEWLHKMIDELDPSNSPAMAAFHFIDRKARADLYSRLSVATKENKL